MYTALPRDRRTGTVHVYITMSVSVLFFTFLPKPVNETGKKERVVCTPELCPKDNAVLHRRQVGFLSANARKRSGPYRKHGSNRQRNAVKRALQEYYPPPLPAWYCQHGPEEQRYCRTQLPLKTSNEKQRYRSLREDAYVSAAFSFPLTA